MTSRHALAEMLITHGLVEHDALDLAIDIADAEERSLLAVLKERNAVDDTLAAKMLSSELNLYRIDLDQRVIDKSVLVELEPRLAHHLRAVPVGLKRTNEVDHLYVAVSDPTGPALAEIQAQTQKQVVPLVATEGALERVLNRCYPGDFEPIRASPNPVNMPAFADVVVGNIIDSPAPADRGGSEWLTASTQEVLEIYAPTLHLPEPKSPTSQARDDDWLRQRLELAQGPQEGAPPPALPTGAMATIGQPLSSTDRGNPRATLDLGSAPTPTTAADRLNAARKAVREQGQAEARAPAVDGRQSESGNTSETPVVQGEPVSHSPPTLDDASVPLAPSIGGQQDSIQVGVAPVVDVDITPVPVRPSKLPSAGLPELRPMTLQSEVPLTPAPVDTSPADPKPADSKPAEAMPAEAKSAEPKSAEAKPIVVNPKGGAVDITSADPSVVDAPPESEVSDMDFGPTHPDEEGGDESPVLGGVTFVCEDQNIRLQLRTALADVLDALYDHNNLIDAKAIIENGTIRRVVLLYPRADGTLVSMLRNLRSMTHPPSVLVISRNRAFEVMRGVDVRIDPPDELSLLPEAIFDALARLGTR